MKTAEEHLLIFEGASAGQYPQWSCPSEQRHKNRQMTSALRVSAIIGRRLRWLLQLQPAEGMRLQCRLVGDPFLSQRSRCDLFSASFEATPIKKLSEDYGKREPTAVAAFLPWRGSPVFHP